MALAIGALIAGWIGLEVYRALTATPGSAIDYAGEMMRLAESYQPPAARGADGTTNVWPLLLEAAAVQAEVVNELWPSRRMDEPGDVPLDYDVIRGPGAAAAYGAFTLEQLRAKAQAGLARLEECGVFALQARIAAIPRAIRPLPRGRLMEVMLPELGACRQLARIGAARMRLANEAGDGPGLVAAFEQTLAIGRAVAQQPLMIDHLVGMAVIQLSFNELRLAMVERPLDEATLNELLAAMDRQLPIPPAALMLEGERISLLDTIQWTHTDSGDGNGRLILSELNRLQSLTGGAGGFGIGVSSRFLNLGGFLFAGKKATTRKANEYIDQMIAASKLARHERGDAESIADEWLQKLSRRYMLLLIMTPGASAALRSRDQHDAVETGTRLMIAVELHRARNGRLPESLESLVPGELAEVPIDPFNGQPFVYRRLAPGEDSAGRAYLLYSLGADGEDNGGWAGGPRAGSAYHATNGRGLDFVLNVPREKPTQDEEP